MITSEIVQQFIEIYKEQLDLTITKEERFTQLKEIGKGL
jgi:hypothetical protein